MSNPTSGEQFAKAYGPNDDCVQIGGLAFMVNVSATVVAAAINAALAAERERYRKLLDAERQRCFDLEQQLAAEREKHRPSEIAGIKVRWPEDETIQQFREQLDAEREKAESLEGALHHPDDPRHTCMFKQQLAAERKALAAAVEALKAARSAMTNTLYNKPRIGMLRECDMIDAVLAKIGGAK